MFKTADFLRSLWDRVTGKSALLDDLESAWKECDVYQQIIDKQIALIVELSNELDEQKDLFIQAEAVLQSLRRDRDEWRAGCQYYEEFFPLTDVNDPLDAAQVRHSES